MAASARALARRMASTDDAVDVSHVCKLTRAAGKQFYAEHDARAGELYERAIAAAEALRQPDCLIVARLRCSYLETRYSMTLSARPGDDSDDAKRFVLGRALALFQAHLPGVFETVERRRAAGTLHHGCCRAHEAEWHEDCLRSGSTLSGEPDEEASLLQTAQLVGVAAHLAAARHAISALLVCLESEVMEEPLLGRCLDVVKQSLQLELERRRRARPGTHTYMSSDEKIFLHKFRSQLLLNLKAAEPRYARILAAWRDVEQSGLLQVVPIERELERNARDCKSLADAQAAKDAGVPLRTCALPSCGAREAHVARFKKCSGCGMVVYCSKQHQTEHWPAHKAARKAARKAASQAAAEGSASQDA